MSKSKLKLETHIDDYSNYSYRPCSGIVVFNKEGKVFVGRRIKRTGFGDLIWQMPQGGIDKGEKPKIAAFRELAEETGITKVKPIAKTKGWLYYDLPKELIGIALKGKYKGQKQKWFLFKFEGTEKDIKLKQKGHPAEFDAYKWIEIEELPNIIIPFKRDIYQKLVEYFAPIIKEYCEK